MAILDVEKAFITLLCYVTVCDNGLKYKLILLNFPFMY